MLSETHLILIFALQVKIVGVLISFGYMGFLFQNEIGHDEEQKETKATSDCLR